MKVVPVTLEGQHVRLEPLSMEHLGPLCEVGLDPELWRFTQAVIQAPDDMRAYIKDALKLQSEGSSLPFATIDKASGRAVGSTRFGSIERAHRRVEIGWTWLGREFQRTSRNTEAKYLMLRHAFEELGCIRVELKTNALNQKSRSAILRIGAKEEGTLRNHMIMPSGQPRHTVYFSIIDSEWPAVKASLLEKLAPKAERESGGF